MSNKLRVEKILRHLEYSEEKISEILSKESSYQKVSRNEESAFSSILKETIIQPCLLFMWLLFTPGYFMSCLKFISRFQEISLEKKQGLEHGFFLKHLTQKVY